MTELEKTPEQLAIIKQATDSTDSFAVLARAGAAKTTTLVMLAKALPKTDILSLAFNKKIAVEMEERLPFNCEAKTLHGLGYKAWWGFIRKKITVKSGKCYGLLKEQIATLNGADAEEASELFMETLQMIGTGKNQGYLPTSYTGHWKPLQGDEEFFASLPIEPTPLQQELVRRVSVLSFKEALQGNIDFDDMIFCPAICSVSWPKPTLTLIDEAQDLSPINHHILSKIVQKRRIIAVGDPYQAIYGFRGALSTSMDLLVERFNMKSLYLTISFRCSKAVTRNAQWLATDMRYPEWAAEGTVSRPVTWDFSQVNDGDAILCRNNAPLFRIALNLLENDRLPDLAGRDLAKPLLKIMDSLGGSAMKTDYAIDALLKWEEKQLQRAREGAKGSIRDKAECVRIMLRKTATLGEAVKYLKHLLSRDGRIHLLTVHKAKGLEFDNVFFLDQHLCRIEKDQDANIKYVAETRAKNNLTYVTTDGLENV